MKWLLKHYRLRQVNPTRRKWAIGLSLFASALGFFNAIFYGEGTRLYLWLLTGVIFAWNAYVAYKTPPKDDDVGLGTN